MAKLKPEWVKTDIPKDVKIKLWRLMRDNPTYRSWEEAIVGQSYTTPQDKLFASDELKYIKMSSDTYKALKYEILHMPPEEVTSLPPELQSWVKQLRPELESEKYPRREAEDYSTITNVDTIVLMPGLERRHRAWILYRWLGLDVKEIAEKLGISSERARRDIEETEKEGVGKVEEKELTKALNVSWLMGRFLSYLRTPDPCQIYPVGTKQIELYETSWVEEHPLFRELKRLLDNKFWAKFRDWKKVRGQYFAKCTSFLDAVHQKAEEETQMQTTECGEEKGLNDDLWQRIYAHVLLKTKTQPLNKLDSGYLKNLDATEFVIQDNNLIAKGEGSVLAKGEPSHLECVSKAYWSLVAGFTSASEPKQIWALWQELGTTERSLNAQAGAVYEEIIPNWFRYRELEI